MQYDLKINLVKKKIKGKKRVLIQLPAGLRAHFIEIARAIKGEGVEPIFWAGSCYGACDLPDYDNADLLIHYGHEEFTAER